MTRCVASGNYVTMNWDRLRTCDDTIQSALAEGEYRRALATLVQGYQHVMVGFCHNMLGDAPQTSGLDGAQVTLRLPKLAMRTRPRGADSGADPGAETGVASGKERGGNNG